MTQTRNVPHRHWLHLASGLLLALAMITSVTIASAVTLMRIGLVPVLTNSMAPSLESGSVAITRQKATRDLSRGDAVILPLPSSDGQRYLHRIVEIRKVGGQTQVTTKGDNNPLADPWTLEVTSSKVPVAVASIPYVGWTTNVLRGTITRLILASLIIVLLIIALVRIRRQLLS